MANIGFIGLGIMGAPMAGHLLKGGHTLFTYTQRLKKPGTYDQLEQRSVALSDELGKIASKAGIPLTQTRVASMLCAFFTEGPVVDWATAKKSDTKVYAKFFHHKLDGGVYLAPSQFEGAFMSLAHTPKDIERTLNAAQAAFKNL